MPRVEHGWVSVFFHVIAASALMFLLLPIAMMFPLSLEPGTMLRFPPQGVSLHWYSDYLKDGAWIASTILSFQVALGAALLATVAGTFAAVGLAQASPFVRNAALLILMSPLFLPTVVAAVAIYGVYAALRLVGTPLGLVAAHAVLTIPFVLLNVQSALAGAPRALDEAAMSLGAGPVAAFWQIKVPLIRRGIAAGAIFSFLISFDEVVIAKFLSGTQAVTLPKRMLDGIFYEMTPMLAAISVLLVLMNAALALLALALVRGARKDT